MTSTIWSLRQGDGPVAAAAIHDGHDLRPEVRELMALSEADRLREEDPFTGGWTEVCPTRIVGLHSRFEIDLNRPRSKAVYRKPEDAWGLEVWKGELPGDVARRSLAGYDAFYRAMERLFSEMARQHGHFIVFDLHSYNHRRGGPDAAPDDPEANPQVNLGTGSMDRRFWAPVVDRFIGDLRAFPFPGGPLDVRENVKFRGARFSGWVHENFPRTGCSIAIEVKKFFMDEWTGVPDPALLAAVGEALKSTVPGVIEELERL